MTQSPSTAEESDRYLALKTVMLPRDTNPHGTIFGGVILESLPLQSAAGACAVTDLRPRGRPACRWGER